MINHWCNWSFDECVSPVTVTCSGGRLSNPIKPRSPETYRLPSPTASFLACWNPHSPVTGQSLLCKTTRRHRYITEAVILHFLCICKFFKLLVYVPCQAYGTIDSHNFLSKMIIQPTFLLGRAGSTTEVWRGPFKWSYNLSTITSVSRSWALKWTYPFS